MGFAAEVRIEMMMQKKEEMNQLKRKRKKLNELKLMKRERKKLAQEKRRCPIHKALPET